MRACRTCSTFAIILLICLTVGCTRNELTRAQQYELAGDNATALEMYQQALARTPSSGTERAQVLTSVGECLYHLDRMQEAFTSFQKAAETDPNNIASHLFMGKMLLNLALPNRRASRRRSS